MKDRITKIRYLFYMIVDIFKTWHHEIWERELDERYCCDGKECGCGGATVRDVWNLMV